MNFERQKRARREEMFFRQMRGDGEARECGIPPLGGTRRTGEVTVDTERQVGASTPRWTNGMNGEAKQETTANMRSLAMVYAPVQPFENLLSPAEGLREGSIFQALIKPLELVGGGRR